MNIFKSLLTFLILFHFTSDLSAGDIKGKVKYNGKAPKNRPLRMDADPVCGASHSEKVFSESFKVNSKGELAECIVYLRGVKYNGGIPKEAVVLDQKDVFTPHMFLAVRLDKIFSLRIVTLLFTTYTLCPKKIKSLTLLCQK